MSRPRSSRQAAITRTAKPAVKSAGTRKTKVAKSAPRAAPKKAPNAPRARAATASPELPRKKSTKKNQPPAASLGSHRLAQLRRIPAFVYLFVGVVLLMVMVPTVNWVYQVVRKPSELFFPVSDDLYKTPSETWRTYASLFVAHATPVMTPELLAALAQKEASGNPVARTYWRWAATTNLFEIYRPASSAVGMYQFTDSTFDEAKRYCIHHHRVVADGPWHDLNSCWFNSLYARVIPSHAVELASSNLDRQVRAILARQRIGQATLRQQQELAIITHLCGAGAGAAYAARGLHLQAGQRCGSHDPQQYVERVMALTRLFAQMHH